MQYNQETLYPAKPREGGKELERKILDRSAREIGRAHV